jgi:hypothetical protein
MLRNAASLSWLGALMVIAGCNPPTTTVAPDTGPREDGGRVMPVVATAAGSPDYSCLGTVVPPTGGAPVSGTFHLYEFISNAPIRSNMIDVFTDNVITDGCSAPTCTTYSTDDMGNLALNLPSGSWFGFRLQESGQTATVLGYNQPWVTAPGELIAPGFAPSTIAMVGRLVGRTFQADTLGSMSGRTTDCTGATVANVLIRVFVGDTEVVTGEIADPAAPLISGLEGTNVTRNGLTGTSGNFVGANIPPSDDCHVEAWGVRAGGEAPSLIGCTEGRVVVGGITVSLTGPLRGDYAPGSRCATAVANAGM